MKKKSKKIFKIKYLIEFLSMFIAVLSAFVLNNWNENKRDRISEEKILVEIRNGLKTDLKDIELNKEAHKLALKNIYFLNDLINNDTIKHDSTYYKYSSIFKEPLSIINRSGYESLKNKGLEIIQNDSLRFKIVNLYEYDYQILNIFENEKPELQATYHFKSMNSIILKYYQFDFGNAGMIKRIDKNKKPNKTEMNIFRTTLAEIYINKYAIDSLYTTTKIKVTNLIKDIEDKLKDD